MERQTTVDLGDAARAELAELIDRQMAPLGLAAMNALAPMPGDSVLDVGCGAGQTLLQLAERVGAAGHVLGVDLSPRVLVVARLRTKHLPQVTLRRADAAALDLPEKGLDGIYSRFGVMFFADPFAAFLTLHRALRSGGRIGFVCWRSLRDNELDHLPLAAAGLTLADDAPFSFESAVFIDRLLRSAGFDDVVVDAFDTNVSSGDVDAMLAVVTRVGALGRVLRETPALLPDARVRVRAALTERAGGGQVALRAATWIVTATAR